MQLFKYYYDQISTLTDSLCELLKGVTDVEATRYYDMPRMTVEQAKSATKGDYPLVTVETVEGDEALTKCRLAFKDWFVEENNLSRRIVHKHPGIVVVPKPKDFAHVVELCAQINAAKDGFKQDVQKNAKEAFEKWQLIHDKYHYLITLAIYRHINCYDADYDAAYFNWVKRRRSERVDVANLLAHLRNSQENVPLGKLEEQWKVQLADEISEVQSVEQEGVTELLMRRQVNYRPEVNLRHNGKMKSYSAGLPIILPALPTSVSALTDLDVSKRESRAANDSYVLVNSRLHLYKRA